MAEEVATSGVDALGAGAISERSGCRCRAFRQRAEQVIAVALRGERTRPQNSHVRLLLIVLHVPYSGLSVTQYSYIMSQLQVYLGHR